MNVNERAPVVAASEAEIAAEPQTVWEILTAFDRWPSWNPDVKEVSMSGGVGEGSGFRWRAGPVTITSTLQRVDPPRLLGWRGKTFGVGAVHVWRLEPRDGHSVVRTEESWDGHLPRTLRGSMRKALQKSIDSGLRYLKAEAERRSNS